MDGLQIALRIVHIVAGVFWVGSVAFMFVYIEPTTRALGPQAAPVMAHLTQRRRLPTITLTSGVLTVVAGLILYWRSSGGLQRDWITSPLGLGFTVGGVAAILALAIGATVVRRSVQRMGAVAGAVASSGGPPSQEQGAEIQMLQRRMRVWGRTMLVLLVVSVVAMAAARYLR